MLEEQLGGLIAAGHDLDHLLSTYSWTQLGVLARSVARSRAGLLNALLGPLVGAVAPEMDYTPADVGDVAKGPSRPRTREERMERGERNLDVMVAKFFPNVESGPGMYPPDMLNPKGR